jgi:hypothetical protein
VAGGDLVDEAISRLFGDTDGDGDVDSRDFRSLRKAFGKRAGEKGYRSSLDFNGNGVIGRRDLVEFARRLHKRLGRK